MPEPLDLQVDGQHYKKMTIQPVELGFANRYDDCIFSAMKYIMRHRDKKGPICLDKATHFCHLRWQLIQTHGPFPVALERIPIMRMVFLNKMSKEDSTIAVALHEWAAGKRPGTDDESAAEIAAMIIRLRDTTYPEK